MGSLFMAFERAGSAQIIPPVRSHTAHQAQAQAQISQTRSPLQLIPIFHPHLTQAHRTHADPRPWDWSHAAAVPIIRRLDHGRYVV
jgi:hypothetical protein